ncbi:MAG: LemA family protein [Nitrospinae bacterium]|nr:LemA family protein [Nitrospinota bacterium]
MAIRHEGSDVDNPPKVDAERVRRMKAMLRRFNAEEVAPKRMQIPEVRAKSLIIAGSLVAVVLFSMSALYNYNVFVNLKETVLSAQGHVESSLQRRANLFVNLVNLTLNHALLEEEVFSYVADVRTRIDQTGKTLAAMQASGAEPIKMDAATMAEVRGSLSRLLAVVEQYPNIKSSETYQKLMDSLVDIENTIADRRRDYNEAVHAYNRKITNFPWVVLAQSTGFSRFEYFKAEENIHRDPLATGKTFERLLPKAPDLGGPSTAPGVK